VDNFCQQFLAMVEVDETKQF